MSLSYVACKELIKRGRNGKKKLGNNTYLYHNDSDDSFSGSRSPNSLLSEDSEPSYDFDRPTEGFYYENKPDINLLSPEERNNLNEYLKSINPNFKPTPKFQNIQNRIKK
jgi:hypothetical protein